MLDPLFVEKYLCENPSERRFHKLFGNTWQVEKNLPGGRAFLFQIKKKLPRHSRIGAKFPYFIKKKKLPRHMRIGAKFPYFIRIIFLVEVYLPARIL